MSDTIPLCVPSVGIEEADLVKQCIDDNYVSSVGRFVSQFEQDFASFVGAERAIATSSGTAAMHVAMIVAGVEPGDLVAVSDFTFVASANAAAYVGADLLLVDSEEQSWNIDGELLYDDVRARADAGRRLPTAVEVVHVLGQPARLEPFLALRDEFGVRLIEDAAESLGATYTVGPAAGRQVGTSGAVAGFSFNGNKVMTTGAGGMLVTDDHDLADRAKHLTTQARLPGPEYFHDEIGFNYRMSNITAALGLAQLRKLPAFLANKRHIARRYDELLDPEIFERPPQAAWSSPSHWLYTVRVERSMRDPLIDALAAADIQARAVWPPLREQAPYRASETLGSGVGAQIHATAVSLPSSVELVDEQIERVASVANRAMRRAVAS